MKIKTYGDAHSMMVFTSAHIVVSSKKEEAVLLTLLLVTDWLSRKCSSRDAFVEPVVALPLLEVALGFAGFCSSKKDARSTNPRRSSVETEERSGLVPGFKTVDNALEGLTACCFGFFRVIVALPLFWLTVMVQRFRREVAVFLFLPRGPFRVVTSVFAKDGRDLSGVVLTAPGVDEAVPPVPM